MELFALILIFKNMALKYFLSWLSSVWCHLQCCLVASPGPGPGLSWGRWLSCHLGDRSMSSCSACTWHSSGDPGPVPSGPYLAPVCFLTWPSKGKLVLKRFGARTGTLWLGSDFWLKWSPLSLKMDSLHFLCNTNKLPSTAAAAEFQGISDDTASCHCHADWSAVDSVPWVSEGDGPRAAPQLAEFPAWARVWLTVPQPDTPEGGNWFHQEDRFVRGLWSITWLRFYFHQRLPSAVRTP